MRKIMGNYRVDSMMLRYSRFIPKLYNLCRHYGFRPGKMIPSRAFCSDESQGFPVILIAKHFGAFPFSHGRVGGIVATDRNAPHALHGDDFVIIQASHVGYNPATGEFGSYRRLQTADHQFTHSCGKIHHVLSWYQDEYRFAQQNIRVTQVDGVPALIIDNQFLDDTRKEGLFLHFGQLLAGAPEQSLKPLKVYSTARAFALQQTLAADWVSKATQSEPIGERLTADLFYFRKQVGELSDSQHQLDFNLLEQMPQIVTSEQPMLSAALLNTQKEFDKTYRTLLGEAGYQRKNLLFVSGVNIDISPEPGQLFPLTKFVPWAAYVQTEGGLQQVLEQGELMALLQQQSSDNPDQIDLEQAIESMKELAEVEILVNQ